jgi:lysine/ornithine N-monooxygenase
MPRKWKPDKARGAKREQKQRLERTQQRKDFAVNMERAKELVQVYCTATDIATVPTGNLEQKYVDWALSRYRDLKFNEEMSQLHKNMSDMWREILVTAKACEKATEARVHAQGKKAHARACAKELERRESKRMQRELR